MDEFQRLCEPRGAAHCAPGRARSPFQLQAFGLAIPRGTRSPTFDSHGRDARATSSEGYFGVKALLAVKVPLQNSTMSFEVEEGDRSEV